MQRRLVILVLSLIVPAKADVEPHNAALRIFSKSRTTWIWNKPQKGRRQLGYLRPGGSAHLASDAPVRVADCPGGYYAIEPRGFVCLDATATLDRRDLSALRLVAPREGLLPYRYALSNGAPMYRRLPTREEWQREERWMGPAGSFRPQYFGNRGHERLAEQRVESPDSPVPSFLGGGGALGAQAKKLLAREIPHGSLLSYTRAFAHEGRTFLLSVDGTAVPADRVRPYRSSSYQGVLLGAPVDLPIAFVRARPRPRWIRHADRLTKDDRDWPLRHAIALDDGEPVQQAGRRFFRTRERTLQGAELFIAEEDASIVRRRTRPPFASADREKWIEVSITRGTLVAYDGPRPVFATLISPGAGGVPMRGRDPVKWSTTPLGVYRIYFKHRTTTMSPDPEGNERTFWIADVPYTQYFNGPFALHVAYWHEDFGEPMSAGCINLSPKDGRWLFDWTLPQVPADWNGASSGGPNGLGTFVVVTR